MLKIRRTAGVAVLAALALFILNAYYQAGTVLGEIAKVVILVGAIVWLCCVAFDRAFRRRR